MSGDLNFRIVLRGTAATRNGIVQNTGGAPLVVSSVAFISGSRQATVSFTLAVNEFKTIIAAVQ